MFVIDFVYDSKINEFDDRIKEAVATKLTELTKRLQEKVIENVSGKILQKQSGQLASSIKEEVDLSNNPMIGSVFVDPATPKAYALEKGGEKNYSIVPTKATLLKFFWEKTGKVEYLRSVNHPPSKRFAYLENAKDEMENIIFEEFTDAIEKVVQG